METNHRICKKSHWTYGWNRTGIKDSHQKEKFIFLTTAESLFEYAKVYKSEAKFWKKRIIEESEKPLESALKENFVACDTLWRILWRDYKKERETRA